MSDLQPNSTTMDGHDLLAWMYDLRPGFGFLNTPHVRLDGFLRAATKGEPHHSDTRWLFRVGEHLIQVRVRAILAEQRVPGDPDPLELDMVVVRDSKPRARTLVMRRPQQLIIDLLDYASELDGGAS